jgi:predicted N-acetyltransferase YhbS
MGIWQRDLMDGRHPYAGFPDFALVEERASGRVVASMGLISQTWSYGGIPFRVGQPENVVTDPDFQGRGLMRRQFELIHELSAARGELMQVIWGVPALYRGLGYEYALRAGLPGGWRFPAGQIPELAEGEAEPFRLRPLAEKEQKLVRLLYERGARRGPFAAVREEEDWAFYLDGYSPGAMVQFTWYIIYLASGQAIGYLALRDSKWHQFVEKLELASGYSYEQALPSLLRQLRMIPPRSVPLGDPARGREMVQLMLPRDHPVGKAIPADIPYRDDPTFSTLYVRVPDVVAFLRHVRPALEANLAGTAAGGYTGEVRINCYRWGLLLRLEKGRIVQIGPWQPEKGQTFLHRPAFPGKTLLQLICGLRRCQELESFYPDCAVGGEMAELLDALFPPYHGGVWLGY